MEKYENKLTELLQQYQSERPDVHTYAITTRNQRITKRPSSETEFQDIHNNLNLRVNVTIEEFAELVQQPYSVTYVPALLNGARLANNWLQQSLFCLDFDDNKVSIEQVLERFRDYEITPNVHYTTWRSTPEHPRFRVCLFLDKVITERDENTALTNSLLKLFPEADQSCKDAARMYLGGIESTVLNIDPISYQHLYDVLNINNIGSDHKNVSRNIYPSSLLENEIAINNNIVNSLSPLYQIKKGAWEDALQQFKVLNEFAKGTWMTHNELFGLACNLYHLKGKLKWMKQVMEDFNKKHQGEMFIDKPVKYSQNNFNILPYVRKMKYQPMKLESFSDWKEDHQYGTITYSITSPRGYVETVEEFPKETLEAVELALNHHIHDALEADDTSIHIIKLPTGIGKTEKLSKVKKDVLIALPNHDLKDEFLKRRGWDCLVTPRQPKFGDKEINKRIEQYYQIGAVKKVHHLLNKIKSNTESTYSDYDSDLAKEHLADLYQSYGSKEMVLTTHHKSLLNDWGHHDTIIYDEDPLQSMIKIGKLKLADLFQTSMFSSEANTLFEFFNGCPANTYTSTPLFNINVDALLESLMQAKHHKGNLFDLIQSKFFMKDGEGNIHYALINKLPEDKKIIILSASVPIDFYEMLYDDRVRAVDISNVEQVGKIIQFTRRSCSRNSLKKRYLDDLVKEVGNLDVITFSELKDYFQNPVDQMHFGKCEGFDELKGMDIAVVGTPHKPPFVYIFYALLAGLEFNTTDSITCHREVKWKGKKFKFASYENEALQRIQFSLIEADLMQAVGRNRTLREPATTKLYSNFPLQLSTEIKIK